MSESATPTRAPERHTLITLGMAIQRALDAWDSTPLQKASDGFLHEAMESLRAAAKDYSVSTEYAIQVTTQRGPAWLVTDRGRHCMVDQVHKCQRFDTADQAEEMLTQLRALYPTVTCAVRAVVKELNGAL